MISLFSPHRIFGDLVRLLFVGASNFVLPIYLPVLAIIHVAADRDCPMMTQ